MAENTLRKIFPLFLCPPTPLLLLGSALPVGEVTRPRRGSNSLPGIPRMAVAIRGSPASPLDLTRFAQVEAASSPVLRHIPKRIPHPVGWGILFGAGDEARTRYLDLGKVALYQMSYARKRKINYTCVFRICQALICIFCIFVRSSIKLQGSNEPSQLIFLPRRTPKWKK